MNGPFSLTASNVESTVDNDIGVYVLYTSHSGPPRYVGMSTELRERLKAQVGEYEFFEYENFPSETAAYEREGNLYHHHKETLDNEDHPPRPHNQVKCPACGIHE